MTAHIGETVTTRAYSLSGSPAWAKRGEYNIAVRRDPNGFVSPWVQDTWQVGQKLTISGPQGQLYYERLRDAKKVVALAGGVGITPFMAMARALRDGLEDFDLTIIYGSRTEAGIVYKKELEEVAAACDKVHVVPRSLRRGKGRLRARLHHRGAHQKIRRRGVQHLHVRPAGDVQLP